MAVAFLTAAATTTATPTTSGGASDEHKVEITLPDAVIQLAPNATSGTDTVIIQTGDVSGKPPTVMESGPSGPIIKTGPLQPLGAGSGGIWLLPISVSQFPAGTTQNRYLNIEAGGTAKTLPITITNLGTTFSWTVLPLGGGYSWSSEAPLMMTVNMGPVPATNLVINSTLTDNTTGNRFAPAGLQACSKNESDCVPLTTLQPNKPMHLYLRPIGDTVPKPGKYEGSIQLVSSEGRSDAATLTVNVTSGFDKFLGVMVLVFGVIVSFVVTVLLRNAMIRGQLRQPAKVLSYGFEKLQGTMKTLIQGEDDSMTAKRIKNWLAELSEEKLEQRDYIPSKVPSIWSPIASPQIKPEYQAHLDRGGNALCVMDRVVSVGLKKVLEAQSDPRNSSCEDCRNAIITAWNNIDSISEQVGPIQNSRDLSEPLLTPMAAAQLILSHITEMKGKIAKAHHEQAEPPGPLTPVTLEHLRFEISMLNLASWLLVAVITSFVGSYIMVINHLDFGRPFDFFLAFIWGLGLPSAGAQLAQLTPSTVVTGIGVKLPG